MAVTVMPMVKCEVNGECVSWRTMMDETYLMVLQIFIYFFILIGLWAEHELYEFDFSVDTISTSYNET